MFLNLYQNYIIFNGIRILFTDPQYQDMFEEGNFRRRKRMRRHAYKSPGIGFKSWPNLADTQLMYRPPYNPFMYPSAR